MRVLILTSVILLSACATQHAAQGDQSEAAAASTPHALLLVSLDDGQLVMQHIDVDAEVCLKSNAQPETRCFKRGAPIYDTDATTIVAYHLETRDLALQAQ